MISLRLLDKFINLQRILEFILVQNKIFRLRGKVQNYAWGGYHYIPTLLNIDNNDHQSFAEYWMGIHSSGVAQIETTEGWQLLDLFLQKNPDVLGTKTLQQFNTLPYLFKVLDVREMLSIQVHPNKIEAEQGFAKEEAEGISINAFNRNYKDKNHKPEMMVALTPFWLLHGFKSATLLQKILQDIEVFHPLISIFNKGNYKALYQYIMEMPQDQLDSMFQPILKKIIPLYQQEKLDKSNPDFWAVRAVINQSNPYQNIDRGIFSIYFFNLLQLQPGQAIFQGAGVPHAYLEGINVEIMANSDNVLRGGLTPKYIDVKELIKHIQFESITPAILNGEAKRQERIYTCPVPDFGLSKIMLKAGELLSQHSKSFEIGILLEGNIQIETTKKKIFYKGESFAIAAGTNYTITSKSGCIIYKAFVPV